VIQDVVPGAKTPGNLGTSTLICGAGLRLTILFGSGAFSTDKGSNFICSDVWVDWIVWGTCTIIGVIVFGWGVIGVIVFGWGVICAGAG